MIMAGNVLVNDVPVTKSGEKINCDAAIRLKEPELKYVSRGALKLLGAIEHFKVNVQGLFAIDIGSSTGGFTEVLLERGATQVYAIDVGTNQLAWRIRSDPRVKVFENTNARELKHELIQQRFDVAVMDVSFISIRLILPKLVEFLNPDARLLILFKPQFELGREFIGDGGIVKDHNKALEMLEDTVRWGKQIGLIEGLHVPASIQGMDGNQEYIIHWRFNPE
jgi:23S rRNA (cytidine1920-2'-O)/16S rRNA (cytidine1409-2'-O)-methyltransferase